MATEELTVSTLKVLASSARGLADQLEALMAQIPTGPGISAAPDRDIAGSSEDKRTHAELPVWDPETDLPLGKPKVIGTREEQDWCSLTYLGGIYAINRRYGRGATSQEVSRYAQKAGYKDGRAVTAWSKGDGPTFNDENKQRWISSQGASFWVHRLAESLGFRLPSDLASPWEDGPVKPA
ncbi:hypothetical protein [Luteococcus sanguinis]|uniref:Uncharacterized protein n=1 Tax=Luteococcus sanguinis TaxID=174038 RepID=A0ABW1X1G5_9ACTN